MKSEYDLKDLFIFYGDVAEDGEASSTIVLKTAEQRFVGERLKGSKNKMFKEKVKYVDVIYPNIAFEKINENPNFAVFKGLKDNVDLSSCSKMPDVKTENPNFSYLNFEDFCNKNKKEIKEIEKE